MSNIINPNSCIRCDISLRRKHMVNGVGKVPSDIMFIGEAPGYYEDKYGLPFIGKAGEILTELLHLAGFNREDVFITNTIRCRPPQNRAPTYKEISNCKVVLQVEIYMVQPNIIVPLGNTALKMMTNDISISIGQVVGKAIKFNKFILYPMYHPSYILRGNQNERQKKMAKAIGHMYSLVEIYRGNFNQQHKSNFN